MGGLLERVEEKCEAVFRSQSAPTQESDQDEKAILIWWMSLGQGPRLWQNVAMDLVLDKPIAADPVFAEAIARARGLLRRPRPPTRTGPALAAALLFATASIAFVTVVVLAPAAPSILVKVTR
jgi:hypothetical protein